MGFMEKVGATLATKYGVVTNGKHGGCQTQTSGDLETFKKSVLNVTAGLQRYAEISMQKVL